ncbi:hypothetical protein KA517_00470 [Candidatus Gracilibacteria bacterium]|nr:hypothetical protein [Candidatus Gracilibacteria bacterium]
MKDQISCSEKLELDANFYFICVGTPFISYEVGFDSSKIGEVISDVCKQKPHAQIIVRSTLGLDFLEKHLEQTNIAVMPEFIREGCGLTDFLYPTFSVIGTANAQIVTALAKVELTKDTNEIIHLTIKEAILLKLFNNSFHALKVSFFNEIARVAAKYDTPFKKVIEVIVSDKKVNLSNYYTKPGLPYGGPCLTKDIEELRRLARHKKCPVPLLDGITHSNKQHYLRIKTQIVHALLKNKCSRGICFYGIAFKEDVNDLRNSIPYKLITDVIDDNEVVSHLDYFFYDVNIKDDIVINGKTIKKVSDPFNKEVVEKIVFLHGTAGQEAATILDLSSNATTSLI